MAAIPTTPAPSVSVVTAVSSKRGIPPIKRMNSEYWCNLFPNADAKKEANASILEKVQLDLDAEVGRKVSQKELHEQRLKDLRELLKLVTQEDWKYTPADKLIGL